MSIIDRNTQPLRWMSGRFAPYITFEAVDILATNRAAPLSALRHFFVLAAGVGLFATSLIVPVIRQTWVSEDAAHSPIVLAIGIWLLVRAGRRIWPTRKPGLPLVTGAVLAPVLIAYVTAQWLQWVTIAAYLGWIALVTVGYSLIGGRALARLWFPIAYLLIAMPLPQGTTALLTQDLRLFLSNIAVRALSSLDYPVARLGVTLFVDRYELLVEEACSGLNSMLSLVAVGLFYAYVRSSANWQHIVVSTAVMVPVAVAANLLRIITTMLLTYHYGSGFAEGPAHQVLGVASFTIALGAFLLIEAVLQRTRWQARD